jgi:hypothetical protein
MKKSIGKAAMMMMAAAMMGAANEHFDTGLYREHRNPYEGETDEERLQRLHKMYGEIQQEHEFVINGERIMARNKKTALKIYANRHPQSKKRKK